MKETRIVNEEQISTNEEGAFVEQIEPVFTRPDRGSRFRRSLTARTARRFVKRLKAIRVARRERLQATVARRAKHRKLHDEN